MGLGRSLGNSKAILGIQNPTAQELLIPVHGYIVLGVLCFAFQMSFVSGVLIRTNGAANEVKFKSCSTIKLQHEKDDSKQIPQRFLNVIIKAKLVKRNAYATLDIKIWIILVQQGHCQAFWKKICIIDWSFFELLLLFFAELTLFQL